METLLCFQYLSNFSLMVVRFSVAGQVSEINEEFKQGSRETVHGGLLPRVSGEVSVFNKVITSVFYITVLSGIG